MCKVYYTYFMTMFSVVFALLSWLTAGNESKHNRQAWVFLMKRKVYRFTFSLFVVGKVLSCFLLEDFVGSAQGRRASKNYQRLDPYVRLLLTIQIRRVPCLFSISMWVRRVSFHSITFSLKIWLISWNTNITNTVICTLGVLSCVWSIFHLLLEELQLTSIV